MTAYKSKEKNDSGKSTVEFADSYSRNSNYTEIKLPCGQCTGCRLERSRQWAIRCMHESQMHKENCFITLTYDEENLPYDQSIDVRHFQLFMKRLRKKYSGKKIRFFHCGEYGELLGRPHYHACLFGHDFSDKTLWSTRNGINTYTSKTLLDLWGKGHVTLGEVNFQTAGYVARYIMKKITGDRAHDHYCDYDPETGELFSIKRPEYTTMSRKPGIGKTWFDKFNSDVYPDDFVVINNRKMRPPKYYDGQYEILNPEQMSDIKIEREYEMFLHEEHSLPHILKAKEIITEQKIKNLKRTYHET